MMRQGELLDVTGRSRVRFGGATYDADLDEVRLTGQWLEVYRRMSDGGWWTIPALAEHVAGTQTALSARVRDMRKKEFGGHIVETRREKSGRWFYRLIPNRHLRIVEKG